NQLLPTSPYRNQAREHGLRHLIDEQYREEIAALESPLWMTEAEARSLETEIIANINRRTILYDADTLRQVEFTIKLQDCMTEPCFNVSLKGGEPTVTRTETRAEGSRLVLETSSRILRYSF